MTTEQRGKWCGRRPRTLRATSSETGWEGASPGGCGGSTALLTPGPQASRTARGFLPHLTLLTLFSFVSVSTCSTTGYLLPYR